VIDILRLTVGVIGAGAFAGFALAAALARVHFTIALYVFGACVAASIAVLAFGAPSNAIGAVALGGVAFAILGALILLTARASGKGRTRRNFAALALGVLLLAAIGWAAPDLAVVAPSQASQPASAGLPLALLILVGAAGAFALLGFGERAVFARNADED